MGPALLIGARFLQFSAAMILFGSPLFFLYGCEGDSATAKESTRWPWQRSLVLAAAAVALLGVVAWVMAETAYLSDDPGDAMHFAAVWAVLSDTRFGHACLIRIALLALSIVASLSSAKPKTRWIVQSCLGGAITASFAWTGHGVADRGIPGAVHLGGDLAHLLAAGVWIGALVPLSLMVWRSLRSLAPADARAVQFGLDRFSAIGIPVLALLVFGGFINSWFLVGLSRWRALVTTDYGVTLLVKLALFSMMLVLAARNRYRWSPELRSALQTQRSTHYVLRTLRTSVLSETILAWLVLLAVSLLGTLAPPVSGN